MQFWREYLIGNQSVRLNESEDVVCSIRITGYATVAPHRLRPSVKGSEDQREYLKSDPPSKVTRCAKDLIFFWPMSRTFKYKKKMIFPSREVYRKSDRHMLYKNNHQTKKDIFSQVSFRIDRKKEGTCSLCVVIFESGCALQFERRPRYRSCGLVSLI